MGSTKDATSDRKGRQMTEVDRDLERRSIDTIRTLAMDAVQAAKSGHPGTPMALAPLAYALWTRVMRYDPAEPGWPDRDRFVLSCGHASMLLYAMLHLTGYDLPLDAIKAFRQWGSPAAGHPERGEVPGVETTTGPLGQGFANAVGMAIAERHMAERFNRPGHELVGHFTWVIASDGDLMEGVAQEAASLAGHLGLGRLCVFWDDNRITIDGATDLAFTEDVGARFEAQGWHVLHLGDDATVDDYAAAAEAAKAETRRPTMVACRTHIGHGSPNKQDTSAAHGAPLGEEEVRLTKEALGWPPDATFLVPEDVAAHLAEAGRRAGDPIAWSARRQAYRAAHPADAEVFDRLVAGRLPEGWTEALPTFEAGTSMATRKASGKVLAALETVVEELVGGSADLAGSNNTRLPGSADFQADAWGGRNIHFGVREHAMGGILNGLALHGGVRPYGGTFLVFSDYMRPSIRLAALMALPVTYVFTHDSIGVGEDGPTHQPIEHLAALRAIPGLQVIRPADGAETAGAWRVALESGRPTALVLSRQGLPELERGDEEAAAGVAGGAYVLEDDGAEPDVVLLASGSEVALARDAAARLRAEDDVAVRVVSFPCWERFADRSADEQAAVLGPATALRAGIEAGCSQGWHRWVGADGALVTIDRFGASAPGNRVMAEMGFTVPVVVETVREALAGRRAASDEA